MSGLRITKLRRHPGEGYWMANVSAGGMTLPVHRKFGSWQIELAKAGVPIRCDVKPEVAAALQAVVKRAEKRERVVA